MSTKNFSARLISANSENIFRVNGFKDGVKRWYYLFVHKSKLSSFKTALETGNLNVDDYGDILEWGAGDNPPEETIKKLEEKYKIKIVN